MKDPLCMPDAIRKYRVEQLRRRIEGEPPLPPSALEEAKAAAAAERRRRVSERA